MQGVFVKQLEEILNIENIEEKYENYGKGSFLFTKDQYEEITKRYEKWMWFHAFRYSNKILPPHGGDITNEHEIDRSLKIREFTFYLNTEYSAEQDMYKITLEITRHPISYYEINDYEKIINVLDYLPYLVHGEFHYGQILYEKKQPSALVERTKDIIEVIKKLHEQKIMKNNIYEFVNSELRISYQIQLTPVNTFVLVIFSSIATPSVIVNHVNIYKILQYLLINKTYAQIFFYRPSLTTPDESFTYPRKNPILDL